MKNSKRCMLSSGALAAEILLAATQAQGARLQTCWPAFDYAGKPAQADDSFARVTVAGSQRDTARAAVASRTMTAPDGRLQIRLDDKTYKGFPAEEYAVQVSNLSQTEPTNGNAPCVLL